MGKDYYKILEVDKNAGQDEIKKAFRKLAHKYHPDKKDGDEAKFKEVNEAYQVLGNEQKRKQYDQFGSTFDQQGGFGGGMNWDDFMRYAKQGGGGGFQGMNFDMGDLGDIFGDIFGFGGGGRRSAGVPRGDDIEVDLALDFKEAVFGVKKTIELYKTVKCPNCHGNKAEPGSGFKTCEVCEGKGRVQEIRRTFLGAMRTERVCQQCQGDGKIPEKLCSKCSGQGVVKNKERIEITIPAGIADGSTLRVPGGGEAAAGGQNGDLYVRLRVKSDPDFERHGNDIYTEHKISFKQAALGDKIEITTLDGTVDLKIPAGTQSSTRFRLRGKGVPRLNAGGAGDFYVIIKVEVPKKLTRHQKKILEQWDE